MDIITIEGDALSALLAEATNGRMPYRLRVAIDVDGVKFKLDEGMWSPPYPVAEFDVRMRALREAERMRGMQIGDGGTQTNYF
jgi:hypothetical protein